MIIHAFTSFTYSYLNRARVLVKTLKHQHPDWVIWAIITDKEPEGFVFNLENELFDELLTAEDLFGDETEQWLFGMDIIEACTAVKGRALQYILNKTNCNIVLYFDPDTAVFNSMQPIVNTLKDYSIVLTPHQIDPEPAEDHIAIEDNEIGSLRWGVFNLGFIAVANDSEGNRFADWWADRLHDYCHDRTEIGIFVDQKWCNLVPCFFDRVKVLRDPGYNVASWNLSQRKIAFDSAGNLNVNGQPLRFFHFTKLGPIGDSMTARYAKDNIEVYEIWSAYKRWILENTDSRIPQGYWYYNSIRDGALITKPTREKYRTEKEDQIANLNQAVAERDGQIASLNQATTDLNYTITEIRNSTSWRLTAPVRFFGLGARKVKTALSVQLSKVMRKAWHALPLSAKSSQRLKNKVMSVVPFFNNFCSGYSDLNHAKTVCEENKPDHYPVAPPQYVPRLALDTVPFEKAARVIAFYLPQFHPITENDVWWGKGFTEWTNVKSAQPQFEGHYQPHVPDDFLGYYDLRDIAVVRKQIELAKQYGIEGFCFYTYWFIGNRLLETPVDNYLDDPSLDLPFCICWANENWTRRWDGLDQDLLMEQRYSPEDDVAFIAHMSKYLRDRRYIRVEGKPLLIVYRPNLFPSMKKTAERWRDWSRNNGLGEIYIAYVQSFEKRDPADYGLDAGIEFPPNNSGPPEITDKTPALTADFEGKVYDWRVFLQRSESYQGPTYPFFRGVCPSWDNTARKKKRGTVFDKSSPDLFQRWLVSALEETQCRIQEPEQRLVFINAWNEWAEGAHLEPDKAYGYAYLEATRLAQVRSSIFQLRGALKQPSKLALIVHAYYIDVLEQLLNRLPASISSDAVLFITTVQEHAAAVKEMAATTGMNYEVMIFENHGRDILPFLKVLRVIKGRGFSHLLKLHTKKSIHRDDGDRWRNSLYDKLLDPRLADQIRPYFAANPDVGLVGPKGYIAPLSYYWGLNRQNIEMLSRRLGFAKLNPEEQQFIAGTMFYARFDALKPLLQLALNDDNFEMEAGQVDGTLAHAIERVIALSAESVGMGIVSSDRVVGFGEPHGAKLEDFYPPDSKTNQIVSVS